jgi:hypothetical protein
MTGLRSLAKPRWVRLVVNRHRSQSLWVAPAFIIADSCAVSLPVVRDHMIQRFEFG